MTSGRIRQLTDELAPESHGAGLARLVDELGELVARGRNHPQTRLSSINASLAALEEGLARGPLAGALADLTPLLEEIRKDTETAANTIMDACEAIQNGGNQDAALSDIFAACGFQDIVGQRCDRAGQLLDIAANGPSDTDMATNRDAEKRAGLLDGPSGQQGKPSQDDIDKLFSDSGVG